MEDGFGAVMRWRDRAGTSAECHFDPLIVVVDRGPNSESGHQILSQIRVIGDGSVEDPMVHCSGLSQG